MGIFLVFWPDNSRIFVQEFVNLAAGKSSTTAKFIYWTLVRNYYCVVIGPHKSVLDSMEIGKKLAYTGPWQLGLLFGFQLI